MKKEKEQKKEKKIVVKKVSTKQQINDLTEMLKRTQAEFINFKTRTEKETQLLMQYSSAEFIRNLLPVIDSFELALKSISELSDKKGIELVYKQLLEVLNQENVRPINALHKKFDPHYHEVMMKEKSDKDSGTIIEIFQKGYMYKERVLRHSKVKLAE